MRTNIDIDNDLLSAAMQATGQSTKRATVEEALRRLVIAHRRENALKDMVGIPWVGDLEEMRSGR